MSEPLLPLEVCTARLRLRRFRPEDRIPFAAINADPEVWRYVAAGPIDRAASDALIDRIEAHWQREGFGLYGVELAATGELAGFVGLSRHRAFPAEVELGWRLARHLWGHGYATEGALACLDLAWDVLQLDRVISIAVAENTRSVAVMRRLGFRVWQREIPYEQWSLLVHVLDRPADRR